MRFGSILFISHEMSLTGAPRSVLRMCRAARTLGYVPAVWTMRSGPMEAEFAAASIPVETVPLEETMWPERLARIESFDLAVCNTAVTALFARACCRRIPTVWYLREAANIRDILDTSPPETAHVLRRSRDIVAVSEYAARALRPYTDGPIRVVPNCVEDEADKAEFHVPGGDGRVRFVQFGTLEHRKGCDVLLEAFRTLPEELRSRAELRFAGPGSESEYGADLLRRIDGVPGASYLGVLPAEERIRALSRADVVVVASRDEASSLVALEGAMLAKPLIVTDHVGARTIVDRRCGFVTESGSADSLRRAMEQCLRRPETLAPMGYESRRRYEATADMRACLREMKKLFALAEKKGTLAFRMEKARNRREFPEEWDSKS